VIKARTMRWMGHAERISVKRTAYGVSFGKPERKRLLWRPIRRWELNIAICFKETGWYGMKWNDLAQDGDKY